MINGPNLNLQVAGKTQENGIDATSALPEAMCSFLPVPGTADRDNSRGKALV